MEPPNNGHIGDQHFVHCSEVVPSSEVEMYGQLMEGGKQFVQCREVVLLSECPLSEVLLYMCISQNHSMRHLVIWMPVCVCVCVCTFSNPLVVLLFMALINSL